MNVRKKSIQLFVFGLLLIQPQYFSVIDSIDQVYDIAVPLLFFYLLFKHVTLKIFNKGLFFQLLFFGAIAVPTLAYSGDTRSLCIVVMQVMALSLYANYGCFIYGVDFLRLTGLVYFIYAIINLATMILLPNGLFALEAAEHSWFLGHKNTLIKYLLPGVYSIGLSALINKSKFDFLTILYMFITIATTIIGGSSTSIVALTILALCWLFKSKQLKINKLITFYAPLIYNLIFFVFIVVLRMQDRFAYLIENILGKQLTLTGRTGLWDRILLNIAYHPLNGYGLEYSETIQARLNYWNVSAHNIVADYLYEGGICCIIIFVILFVVIKKRLDRLNGEYELVYIFNNIMFLAFSIVWSTDTFVRTNIQWIFFMLIIAYNLPSIVDNYDNTIKNNLTYI